MKERLVQLLDLEHLSPSKFADIIGVQRSSISHVLSGRNKPSFDFLQKTLKAFPGLNADWLIQGEGTMYEHMGREMPGSLFDAPETSHETPVPENIMRDPENLQRKPEGSVQIKDTEQVVQDTEPSVTEPEPAVTEPAPAGEPVGSPQHGQKRKIVQVMVFYDDDTFRSFGPSQ